MRFAFIEAQAAEFPIQLLGRVLGVSRSGYYAWRQRPPSARERADQELAQLIQAAHHRSRGTYGAPRIHAELQAQGRQVGRKRVARLMRSQARVARPRRRCKVTTRTCPGRPVAPNVRQQQFHAGLPNEKWLADITYIPTREGWLYLAAVLDAHARRIVGWTLSRDLTQDLVLQALQMAWRHRHPTSPLLHHSDRGSQYTAETYQKLLKAYGITVSMSAAGNCYDNAMMESFFSTLKAECVTGSYSTRQAARHSIFEYIEVWYNRERRHSSLGCLSPAAFEQAAP